MGAARKRGPDPAEAAGRGALWCALDRLDARLLQLADGPTSIADTHPGSLCQGLAGAAPFAALAAHYGIDDGDLDVLTVALAPTVDLRYAAAYRVLRDHGAGRQPTVDLVLDVLSGRRPDALDERHRFATTGPLVGGGALRLVRDDAEPSWLAAHVEVDPQVVRLVYGDDNLDDRLAVWCSLIECGGDLSQQGLATETADLLARYGKTDPHESLCLHLHGPSAVDGGGVEIARTLAGAAGQRLLVVDLARLLDSGTDPADGLTLALREAALFDRTPVLDGVDLLAEMASWRRVLALLREHRGPVVLIGAEPLRPAHGAGLRVKAMTVSLPDTASRQLLWAGRLDAAGVAATDDDIAAAAAMFRLTAVQITDAAELTAAELAFAVGGATRRRGRRVPRAHRAELFAAARAQSGPELSRLAVRVETRATWADLVLPDDALEQLRELCSRVALHDRVLDDWGLGELTSRGTGVSALFVGPSGTGKTMAAEVVAQELGLALYRIDLAGVVSKYIGETEKNLDSIFAAARDANVVLLFDEADALFGKRSEVKDSHDRYANVEIAYLLQQLESHDGLAILTSNLPRNVDEAFVRRLSFTVHFPFPDEIARRRLWARMFPASLPVAADLDIDELARRFKLSGATIRNAVVAAGYRAATQDRQVGTADVLHGIRREFQKLGKALDDEQLGIRP